MMRSIFSIVSVFYFSVLGFSQSGYLGKNNALDLRFSMGPSYKMVNEIDNLERSVHRMKFATTSYSLSYSRVLNRNVEVTLGYQFANIQCMAEDRFFRENVDVIYDNSISWYTGNLLDEPRINYHGGVIGFNFYRLGSIAPIGKYVGFTLAFGRSVLDSTNAIITGLRDNDPITSSFFKTVSDINFLDSAFISTTPVKNFNLRARFGRNYPLTDFLMLSLGMSFPIFSSYQSGFKSQFGFQLKNMYDIDRYGDWTRYLMNSVKTYHRITFDVAIKFLF